MQGKVFSIEEFSTFDGPGIRTTVFLKGCPLSCVWCHNPEGQRFESEYVRLPNGCIGCGACEKMAKKTENGYLLTEKSAGACPNGLVVVRGIDYTANDLSKKLLKNADILNSSGGGITFSGGEPTSQSEFLLECLDILHGKVHTALQTCGYVGEKTFRAILQKVDYVLFDLKLFDNEEHKKYCGVDNEIIKNNYATLAKSSLPFVTRIPLIPSITDTSKNLTAIARFMAQNGVNYVEVLPYNKLTGGKYPSLLRKYEPCFDENQEIYDGKDIFEKFGIKCVKM